MKKFFATIIGAGLVAATLSSIPVGAVVDSVVRSVGLTSLTGLGTNVATALGINIGTSGAVLVKGTSVCADLSDGTTNCSAAVGQLPGTTTNDVAASGKVGQLVTSTCPTGNATITVTIASPGVVTYTSHGFSNTAPATDICPIIFTTTGALPTGITSGTTYWTVPSSYATNTFQIATSVANAITGTSVNTSGSQSGTHTGTRGSGLVNLGAKSVSGMSLTAGDWDVWCSVRFASVGVAMTSTFAEINPTDNTLTGVMGAFIELDVVYASSGVGSISTPSVPTSLSGTTSEFCTVLSTFVGGSVTANGKMVARRRR